MSFAIASTATRLATHAAFQLKRYSPEILTGVGVAAVGVGTVMACRATLDAHNIVEKYNEELGVINQAHEISPVEYPESSVRRARLEQVVQAGLGFVKLYGPSVLIIAAGIAAILGGHHILRMRNTALALAYTSLSESFLAYRGRVRKTLGDSADDDFMHDKETVSITTIDENGNESQIDVEKIADTAANANNPGAIWFDETNPNFSQDPGTNAMWLRQRLEWLRNKEIAQGYLIENDARKDLDFKQTSAGAVRGWVYDGTEESLISYGPGVMDIIMPNVNHDPEIADAKRAFLADKGGHILLELNVQGPVYNLIDAITLYK